MILIGPCTVHNAPIVVIFNLNFSTLLAQLAHICIVCAICKDNWTWVNWLLKKVMNYPAELTTTASKLKCFNVFLQTQMIGVEYTLCATQGAG